MKTSMPVNPEFVEFNVQWLAGFFDGEGSIGIYPRNANRNKTIRYYVLVVSLAQSGDYGEWILKNLQQKYGGSVYSQIKSNHKLMWKWNICAKKAVSFLYEIESFLIVKRSQAITGQSFMKLPIKRVGNSDADAFYHQIKIEKE